MDILHNLCLLSVFLQILALDELCVSLPDSSVENRSMYIGSKNAKKKSLLTENELINCFTGAEILPETRCR